MPLEPCLPHALRKEIHFQALSQWLRELGLSQYAELFAVNDIDRDVLPNFDSW